MTNLKELEIRLLPIKKLRPYKRNARTHPKTQLEQLKASLCMITGAEPIWKGQEAAE